MPNIGSSSPEHFSRDFALRQALDDYYNDVLASKEEGFSAEKFAPKIRKIKSIKLNNFVERIITLVVKTKIFSSKFNTKLNNLLEVNREAKELLYLHRKASMFHYKKGEIPFVFLQGKLFGGASELKIKSKKYQKATDALESLQLARFDSKPELAESIYRTLPHSVQKVLIGILELQGIAPDSLKAKNLLKTLLDIEQITDDNGNTVLQQLSTLLVEKRVCHDDLCVLGILQTKVSPEETDALMRQLSSQARQEFEKLGAAQAIENAKARLNDIRKITIAILEEASGKLAVFEVSATRLGNEIPAETLQKPVSVTMVGVEYAGLVKEGGLAEALEGLSQGLLHQHPDNKVRLIYPKFSLLPKNIQERLNATVPKTYVDSSNQAFNVYTIDIQGVECHFIDHPSFVITGDKLSIYAGKSDEVKERFAIFSSLAADLLCQLPKTDMIHLHDWHVAAAGIKLRNTNKEIAPIVFTYHNNQREAQGRYFSEVYNYEPIMQTLRDAHIATQNVNLMVEAVEIADAVTTVSKTFAIESQSIERGEGVSFAMRQASRSGKLSGIVNGTNVDRWDPKTSAGLKEWRDVYTQEKIDLSYGAQDNIVEQKQKAKIELQKWVKKEFPDITFDSEKPIITYIGRYDWYQKGLDAFEEAIEEVLKNGGQFISMGTHEDTEAAKVLDRIQKKYKDRVLLIRDYKAEDGRLYYQQGSGERQGIGPLVRAASDFIFMPSRYEPCGLVQFEGWLFGSLAIGSDVGGLRDTVTTQEESRDACTGYLFDRNVRSGPKSLQGTIAQALDDWYTTDSATKQKTMSRLMQDAKKCSWNDAPSGFSPTEQYRFVYENAKRQAEHRIEGKPPVQPTYDIARYRRILGFLPKPDSARILEEKYLEAYTKKDIKNLGAIYRNLPKHIRRQMPPPYALQVKASEYQRLGAHHSPEKTTFRVYAPHAKEVFLQLFDVDGKPLKPVSMSKKAGEWSVDVSKVSLQTTYQYIIDGAPKIDPYGIQTTQVRGSKDVPRSVVASREFLFSDQKWIENRAERARQQPMSIYELHPTSWQTKEGQYLNYRELAEKIAEHCQKTGHTHVELMGILEHPDQRSFGYQVSNYFSPNSRMGSLDDFKCMVDYLHRHNIGVILDWIPAHFCIDDYALSKFDGTNQFEPSKIAALFSLRSIMTHFWSTRPFDYRKPHVRDFLVSSASYWIKEMHIDGLRVDAVRAILSSEHPQSSKLFLRTLNEYIHKEFDGVITIAEDYSGSFKVTKAVSLGGLGFDLKWNINWTKHILDYIAIHPSKRKNYYNRLIQAIQGDLYHKMVMGISHDEILKKPLFDVTEGLTEKEQYANLRSLYSLMMCLPGKKLLFMGSELGSASDWKALVHAQKGLLDAEITQERVLLLQTVSALNALYKNNKAFWLHDDNAHDLEWIEKNDPEASFIAYRRVAEGQDSFACFHNFSHDRSKVYQVVLKGNCMVDEVFNSNALDFGGDGTHQNREITRHYDAEKNMTTYRIQVAPLSCVVMREGWGL